MMSRGLLPEYICRSTSVFTSQISKCSTTDEHVRLIQIPFPIEIDFRNQLFSRLESCHSKWQKRILFKRWSESRHLIASFEKYCYNKAYYPRIWTTWWSTWTWKWTRSFVLRGLLSYFLGLQVNDQSPLVKALEEDDGKHSFNKLDDDDDEISRSAASFCTRWNCRFWIEIMWHRRGLRPERWSLNWTVSAFVACRMSWEILLEICASNSELTEN